MNEEAKEGEDSPKEANLDLPPEFREVAEKYGREMFSLVYNAGMAGQAAQVLANAAEKHRSQHSAHAVGVLSRAFNAVSNAYCRDKGWDEAILAQCDRDIGLAFQGKLIVPQSSLILDS